MLLTFIKLPFVFKIFVLSIFEWPLTTCLFLSGRLYSPTLNKSCLMSYVLQVLLYSLAQYLRTWTI